MTHKRFITFEGIEGSGKTTQVKKLNRLFRQKKISAVFTREPGGTPIAERIREILVRTSFESRRDPITPLTELLLMEAARSQHVTHKILPALKKGHFVVCDRFADASSAYQGVARKLGLGLTTKLNQIATGGVMPSLTFLLDIDCRIGLKRSLGRANKEKRFESEKLKFHMAVRRGYLTLAKRNKQRFVVLDGGLPPDKIFMLIRAELKRRYRI